MRARVVGWEKMPFLEVPSFQRLRVVLGAMYIVRISYSTEIKLYAI